MMDENRIFFVKRAGRITGPFSAIRLKAMINEGRVSGEDLVSKDKQLWAPMRNLYPVLGVKAAVLVPEDGNAPAPAPAAGEDAIDVPFAEIVPEAPQDAPVPGAAVEADPGSDRHLPEKGFVRFCRDAGAVIALVWDFEAQLPVLSGKERRAAAVALVLGLLPAVLAAFFFGRAWSRHFHVVISPLIGASVVVVTGLLALGSAWLMAGAGLPAGTKRAAAWPLLGIALFMDYGMYGGAAIALAGCFSRPGLFLPGGAALVGVLVAAVCGAVLQTGVFLEKFRGIPQKWSFLIVPLLTAVTAAADGLLIALI